MKKINNLTYALMQYNKALNTAKKIEENLYNETLKTFIFFSL